MFRSFPRRVFLELRQFGIHRVPWLRIGRPNFVLRFVQTRIIQAPSRNALSEIAFASEQARAAFRTKTANVVAHLFTGCAEIFGSAPDNLERLRRDVKNWSVCSAGCFLAIAAVTVERHNWVSGNFVTNRTARAATGNWFHLNNSLGRDDPGCAISFCRSRLRFQCFRFPISRGRIRDQRFKKMMRCMGHLIHRAIECFFVCARWLCKSGKLPNKLQRRSANLIARRRW